MGREYESSQFWFYFLYPFVMFSRLALTVYSYGCSVFENGSCIWFDMVLMSVVPWFWYLFGLVLWHLSSLILLGLEPFLQPMTLFFMDHTCSASRRACRLARPMERREIILALDCRLLVLSEFMCYYWWSCFLASSSRWYASLLLSVSSLKHCLSFPRVYLLRWFPPWPPDGWITNVLLFIIVVASHFLVVGTVFCSIFQRIGSDICYAKLVALHLLSQSRQCFCSIWLRRFSRFKSLTIALPKVFTTVLSTCEEEMRQAQKNLLWDSDSIQVVLDNSATTHIWNKLEHFEQGSISYFDDDDDVGVVTIGSSESRPLGRGCITLQIKDNDGIQQDIHLENVLYFPDSPVNVFGITSYANQINDSDGTWIKTQRSRSHFVWNFGKHELEFEHPQCRLPMITVNVGFKRYKAFTAVIDGMTDALMSPPMLTCQSCLPTDEQDDIAFISDEVPTDSPTDVPSYSFCVRHSVLLNYKVGDRLRLVKNGINEKVDVTGIVLTDDATKELFQVALPDGRELEVTHEFLRHHDDTDVGIIPVTPDQVRQHLPILSESELEALVNPVQPDPLLHEFMAWHERSGHLPFNAMFALAEKGIAPARFKTLKGRKLICPSCLFGKAKRRKWRQGKAHGSIRGSNETPGSTTSIDHVISAQPGLVPRLDGRHTRDRINAGCVFIDHYSGLSYTHLQTSVDNEQTLQAKLGYERFAASHGVKLQSFRTDNGVFAEKFFRDNVSESSQTISYCAVGAHHQNGLAEREIRTLTEGARANLLHAQRRWPKAVGPILWPFAWKDYENKKNSLLLDSTGRSALNRFSGVDIKPDLRNYHPFGCPVFVLDSRLQSGASKIPKWDPRSRVGIYLGHSPCHAGTVALVLNPRTLRVSPQFHLVFDDEFSTVSFMTEGTIPPHWEQLVTKSAQLASDEDFDLATSWANDFIAGKATSVAEEDDNDGILLNASPETAVSEEARRSKRVTFAMPVDETSNDESSIREEAQPSPVSEEAGDKSLTSEEVEIENGAKDQLLFPTMPDLDAMTLRRSKRTPKPKKIFTLFILFTAIAGCFASCGRGFSQAPLRSSLERAVEQCHRVNAHFDQTLNVVHHAVLMAGSESNDVYTFKEMLKQEDAASFIEAMVKEVGDHESRDHWSVVPRSTMPVGTKTILAIWSFKRKRFPDGRINKHKARLCAHGGMQTWGVNYWETYSPVVNWLSVRTLMALSIIHDLETRSIDFVLAFPQADLEVPVYMEMPVGFSCEDARLYVLRLNKNLYGLKNASLNFFNLLKEGLELRGYDKQSASDACVFLGKSSIILVYVDDCIIFQQRGSSDADNLIRRLQEGEEKFVFTDDGNLEQYLGVDVKRKKNGSIELTQPHLIQRILDVLNITPDVNPKPTPVVKPVLYKDLDGLMRKCNWNYRQAVGMLTYLQGTTRPEISMAVHQTARFSVQPMLSHERAIMRIGKYLKGSKEYGLNFRPDASKGLECFVDADFAGGWNKNDGNTADSVMSRTGYVIMYAGCPITWCSKLQTEVALSTTEAEYIALSQSLREVIPIMQLLREINEIFPLHIPTPEIHCKTWEDNNGCIALAQNNKFSPRTKHIALKYHHFREHVKNGTISIHPIDTKEQTADILTKPVDESLFLHLRRKLSGW